MAIMTLNRESIGLRDRSEALSENPKTAKRKHVKVIHNGIHEIEGEVLPALLYVSEMIFVASYPRSDGRLSFPSTHSQFRNRQSKELSWRAEISSLNCTDVSWPLHSN
jgi:hypothetical protein